MNADLPAPDATASAALEAWRHAPLGMAWLRAQDGQLLQANASLRLLGVVDPLPPLSALLASEEAAVLAQVRAGQAWTARLPLGGRLCDWHVHQPAPGSELLLSVWPLREASRDAQSTAAQLGHELRTPLAGVISLTELVLSSELADRQRKLLELSLQSGRQLLELINHTLDLARLDAGALQVAPRAFALHDCLRDAMAPLLAQAHAKGIQLQARVQPGLPGRLRADDLRLRQVLANLVGNAVKFTERGQVRLDVRRSLDVAHGLRLHFEVSDTGVGLSPEALQRLFRPFAQADATVAQRHGGSGLGLVIAQRLVRLLGGQDIEVESQPGLGACFRFSILAEAEA
ncbi:MAG: hypothetical protein J0L58_02515 [Burkholderiales bacterium]|uniref:sensor histidine kinase n=1 Tax=Inhella sp. TaxID=1921806 RepID=UPI001AC59475|nr:hypothetical protein [Burkholderiales bacterium]